MFVTGEAPDDRAGDRRDGGVRARASGRARPPLLEPRLRAARRGRRPRERDAVHRVRRRDAARPARPRTDDLGRAGAARARPTSSTSSRAPRRASRTATLGGVAAMGQLWSTVGDLARWGSFLVGGSEGVLDPATVDEMWAPQVMLNPDDWTVGWGLGLELVNHERPGLRRPRRRDAGLPRRPLPEPRVRRSGAAVLTNAGTRAPTRDIALELAAATLELWPPDIEPWRPESRAAAGDRARSSAAGGRRATSSCFSWKDGKLTARAPGRAAAGQAVGLRAAPDGGYRVVSGPRARRAPPGRGRPADLGRLRLHARPGADARLRLSASPATQNATTTAA